MASFGEFRKLLSSIVMFCEEAIQIFFSVGDLLPAKVQFSTVAPLAVSSIAQKLVVPGNVQSFIVNLWPSVSSGTLPKLIPLSTAPGRRPYTIFADGE